MKRRYFVKCAAVLAAGAWSLKAAPLGRPEGPDKSRPTVKLTPQLKAFIKAKEEQARSDTKAVGDTVSPDVWAYFAAANQGDFRKVSKLWETLAKRCGQYEGKADPTVRNAAWQPILEVDLALRAFVIGDPKFSEAFGTGIIQTIPPGSIYFGGTDPGRGLVTALCKSQINADPFFTLTQNALADSSYLAYLRRMYGAKIQIPSDQDSQNMFTEYLADAKKRLEHDNAHPDEAKQIKPGEDVKIVGDQVNVSGQVSVMTINGLLTKLIFDKNPDKEFFVEESFPLEWMYPHLTPHDLIMRINREPLSSLPENDVQKDRAFWTRQIKGFVGDWLTYETPIKDVCAFAQRVFADKNLANFNGDPAFVQDEDATKEFSKLRSSIAGIYACRRQNAKSDAERAKMGDEADFAFRQAFALCPSSPEVLFRYTNLLLASDRLDDAILLTTTGTKVSPENEQIASLQKQLQLHKERK